MPRQSVADLLSEADQAAPAAPAAVLPPRPTPPDAEESLPAARPEASRARVIRRSVSSAGREPELPQ